MSCVGGRRPEKPSLRLYSEGCKKDKKNAAHEPLFVSSLLVEARGSSTIKIGDSLLAPSSTTTGGVDRAKLLGSQYFQTNFADGCAKRGRERPTTRFWKVEAGSPFITRALPIGSSMKLGPPDRMNDRSIFMLSLNLEWPACPRHPPDNFLILLGVRFIEKEQCPQLTIRLHGSLDFGETILG